MRSTSSLASTSHTRCRLWLKTIRSPVPLEAGRAVSAVRSVEAPAGAVEEDDVVVSGAVTRVRHRVARIG